MVLCVPALERLHAVQHKAVQEVLNEAPADQSCKCKTCNRQPPVTWSVQQQQCTHQQHCEAVQHKVCAVGASSFVPA